MKRNRSALLNAAFFTDYGLEGGAFPGHFFCSSDSLKKSTAKNEKTGA